MYKGILIVAFLIAALAFLLPAAVVLADTVTIGSSKDNTLIEDPNGLLSNGAGQDFFAGNTNDTLRRRGLIAFNVAGSVPAGSTITGASLRLNMSRTKAPTEPVSLHVVQQDWGEGASDAASNEGAGAPAQPNDATWKHRFYPSIFWSALGGVFSPTASATTDVAGVAFYTWSSPAMVADVQTWLDNPAGNFGWAVIGFESGRKTAKRFDSHENATVGNRPQLTITYNPPVITGACCTGVTCTVTTQATCTGMGGTYRGNATPCSPNPCSVPAGACCASDGSCSELTGTTCSGAGGTYEGDGTTCSPNPCPQPTGACCAANGACSILTLADCTAQGGAYQGNGASCSTAQCPVILTPFVDPLPIPAVAQPVSGVAGGAAAYEIAMTEFPQQLHRDLPPTRVWGYGGTYPGPTILAAAGQPVTVTWINDLRDSLGFLRSQHYLPVDTCLHGPDVAGTTARTVVHLHGGHVPASVDGYPEATLLPGEQTTYVYPNSNQLPATLWYHDHALGITRLNVIMGLAGFYLLRDSFEGSLGLPSGEFEIGLAIQDRKFRSDGSFDYPAAWSEMFFGDTILVNGKVWPYLNVKQGKYRFRILNGSTSRVYTLGLSQPGMQFQQIGTDGGLLPAPVTLSSLTLGTGERADVILDFEGLAAGTEVVMTNSAPIMFPGTPGDGVIPNVMMFVVTGTPGFTGPLPSSLRPIQRLQESQAVQHRSFELRKLSGSCAGSVWTINGMMFDDISEYPRLGTTEVWSFINRSGVMHPMHMHLVMFQVLDRQPFTVDPNGQVVPAGTPVPPAPEEAGWKDTVQAPPNQITRVITRFDDYTGLYPYHCHILEHEDNEMMRQFRTIQCGNGAIEPTEQCDDGNAAGGDACSARCRIEQYLQLTGLGQGGTVQITVEGVVIGVTTTGGETPGQVAAALAAAINADPTLSAMGAGASAVGPTLVVEGVISDTMMGDPGIGEALDLDMTGDVLWWSSVGGRTGYDVIRGDLGALHSSRGNFAVATQMCLTNDQAETDMPYPGAPAVGQGWWFLVRKVTASGHGTYDEGSPRQVGLRDAEIGASGNDCP